MTENSPATTGEVVALDDAASRELTELEGMIGDKRSPYWRGPDAEKVQARYLHLLRVQNGEDEGAKLAPLPPDMVRQQFSGEASGRALMEDWNKSGGVEIHAPKMQAAVMSIVEGMDGQRQFIEAFDKLPEGARAAVYADLALGVPNMVPAATTDAVKRFATTTEGAELVKEWGPTKARRNVAVIRERLWRTLHRMTPEDVGAFLDWFDGLDSPAAKRVLKGLV